MIAGIGPVPGVVNPAGNIGSAGVPASAVGHRARVGDGEQRLRARRGRRDAVPSNTPAGLVTPGRAVAIEVAPGARPFGAWSR